MLTLSRLEELARTTLVGGTPGGSNSVMLMANQAGRHLMSMHRWGWAEGNQAYLPFRVSVPTTASSGSTRTATYTELTKRLEGTGFFSDYIFKEGDLLRVFDDCSPDPTDDRTIGVAIPGLYEIAAKVSDDAIDLVQSPVRTGVSTAEIQFNIDLSYAELPEDFGDALEVETRESLTSRFEWTDLSHILRLRSDAEGDSRVYRGAINYTVDTIVNRQPLPRIELYPAPITNDSEALRCFYRSGWKELTDDNDILRIPSWIEPLYIEVFRCFLLGLEEHDIATVNLRLAELQAGPVFKAAKSDDGRTQGNLGRMTQTHVRPSSYGVNYSRRQINSPS